MEYELTEIYQRLCNGESDFLIMTTLYLQERNYYKYKKRLEVRLMEYQRNKTVDTIFMESQLFKNRMLNLYKALENQVTSADKTSGTDKAKCAEIAANIAIEILKLESEGIRAVKEGLVAVAEAEKKNESNNNNNDDIINDNVVDDDDRKF